MNRENLTKFKCAIIGGGASGLALSILLSRKFGGHNVSLFEMQDRVGKKLLTTGNGQCNLTNADLNLSHFHSGFKGFCSNIVKENGNEEIKAFFNDFGILTVNDGGKIYPLSKQASSVVDALRFKVLSLNVQTFLNTQIVKISKKNNAFSLQTLNGEFYTAENVIVSVGGNSYKSKYSPYSLLENLGHKITKLYPSIVQLKTNLNEVKGLKGLKQKAKVTAILNGKEITSTIGDLLFTDYGVSGNSIFYLSSYLVDKTNAKISVDFCPDLSLEELTNFIKNKQRNCSYLTGEHLLSGVMNGKISCAVIKNSLNKNLNSNVLEFDAERVAKAVKNYSLTIVGSLGYDMAQVTKGGISVEDFDSKTLESKLVKNLYATGEVLDVDGDCGGYNLTWAFLSAFAVANSIK